MNPPLKVCYLGYYSAAYPRNAVLRHGLADLGVEVRECRIPESLAPGTAGPLSRVPQAVAPRLRYELLEFSRAVRRGVYVYRVCRSVCEDVDAVILAEFNQGLAAVAFLIARLHRAPLIVDFLVSLYDVAVNTRSQLRPRRPRALYRKLADRLAIAAANLLVVDTQAQADFLERMYGGVVEKVVVIPVGAPDWELVPTPLREWHSRPLEVLYYGYFNPLHGVGVILETAHLLAEDSRFLFRLVGTGQERDSLKLAYDRQPSGNVVFADAVPESELPSLIASADICLGVFGDRPAAERVVPNKVWQCLAAGRPVITRDGSGPESFLTSGEHCLLVRPGDAGSLSRALVYLADHWAVAAEIAANGAQLVRSRYTSRHLGSALCAAIVGARAAPSTAHRPS